jgi:hypothetical protein
MSQATNYLEDELIKHLFRTGSFTKPTVLAFALYTAAPGEAGGGTEVTNAGSYTRQDLPPLDANWAATSGSDGLTSNLSAITYSAPTGNWGTCTHMAILDSTTHGAGNMLLYGTLTNSRIINSGDAAPNYAIGAVTITIA